MRFRTSTALLIHLRYCEGFIMHTELDVNLDVDLDKGTFLILTRSN
jgi:hypothetical protein